VAPTDHFSTCLRKPFFLLLGREVLGERIRHTTIAEILGSRAIFFGTPLPTQLNVDDLPLFSRNPISHLLNHVG